MDDGRYVLYDDAFISFRYARNLAGGEGLVFNPGERVEGYTNMLWTCLLAGAMALGGDPILAAKVLGVVSGVIVLALSALLTHRLSPGSGLWVTVPGLLLSATASLPRHALSGMETVSFSACLLLALWIEAGSDTLRNRFLAGLALGLATLTRPEGLLFFACLSMGSIVESAVRRKPAMDIARGVAACSAGFLLLVLPHVVWRHGYYGYLVPNTFYAKAGGLSLASLSRGLIYLRNELLLLLNGPLFLWGMLGLRATQGRGMAKIAATLTAYLLYLVAIGGDDWAVFGPRFLVVVLPWFAVLGATGLLRPPPRRLPWRLMVMAAALVTTAGISIFEARGYRGVIETMNRGWWTAAEWLSANAADERLLAVDAAGIIPYHTGLPVVDMLGLNDVHIAHLDVDNLGGGLSGHEKYDPLYVLAREPAFICSWLDSQGWPVSAGLASVQSRVRAEYELSAYFLMRIPLAGEATRVDADAIPYDQEAHARGYIYGIFRRRAES